jgi:hypothetical protein
VAPGAAAHILKYRIRPHVEALWERSYDAASRLASASRRMPADLLVARSRRIPSRNTQRSRGDLSCSNQELSNQQL